MCGPLHKSLRFRILLHHSRPRNSTSASSELVPATSDEMASFAEVEGTPVLSEAGSSHSTLTMNSDTALDVAASSINYVLRLDTLFADDNHNPEPNHRASRQNFPDYGTFHGDHAGSLNHNNMLLALSNVGSSFYHHVWEIGSATHCLSQACRAQRLKVLDQIIPSQEHIFSSTHDSWLQQQINVSRPLLTWVSMSEKTLEPSPDNGLNEQFSSLLSFCRHLTAQGLYGCISGWPWTTDIHSWAMMFQTCRVVGWFFIGRPRTGIWLTNCHVLAGLGPGSIHEYFENESTSQNPRISSRKSYSWSFWERVASLIRSLALKVGQRQKAIALIKRVGDHFSFAYSKWTNCFPDPQYYLSWSAPRVSVMSPLLDEGSLSDAVEAAEPSSSSHEHAVVARPFPASSSLAGRTPLELPLRKGPTGVDLPTTSKTLADLGLNEAAQRDFEALRESILEQKPQVKNVQHIIQNNGREYFLITFDRVFSEFRFLKESQSITISCCGTGGRAIYGHDVAAHITHILYAASVGVREAGNFGAGTLKRNGFHGKCSRFSFMYIRQSM